MPSLVNPFLPLPNKHDFMKEYQELTQCVVDDRSCIERKKPKPKKMSKKERIKFVKEKF